MSAVANRIKNKLILKDCIPLKFVEFIL